MNTPEDSLEVGSDALLSYKRLLFETAEECDIGGDGMFAGMKLKVVTKPLPPGVIGLLGTTLENAVFIKDNDQTDSPK